MLKKWIVWGMIAFLVFFVAFRPGTAGYVVEQLGNTAVDVLQGVGNFFSGLVS